MRVASRKQPGRTAFTLVELLIVVGIIAIIVSLLSSAVFRTIQAGRRAAVGSEINQLSIALETFKAKYGTYPPSRFLVSNTYTDYSVPTGDPVMDPLRAQSLAYINQFWPRIVWSGIDWTGGQLTTIPAGGLVLQGDQCLVFFLGGIPTVANGVNGCLGFATNPQNPTQLGGSFYSPFYDGFQSNRLIQRGCYNNKGVLVNSPLPPFFSFQDYYQQQPYLYFSSGKRRNGYNPLMLSTGAGSDAISLVDGTGNLVSIAPYYQSTGPTQYLNPSSHQIICAGKDGKFGAGGILLPPTPAGAWTSTNAAQFYPGSVPGADDQSSFYSALLGASGS
jgi:general secretion pathway protein G